MGGVGDEPPLALHRRLEFLEAGVELAGQPAQLIPRAL